MLILFACLGLAWAGGENETGKTPQIDEMEELINSSEDNGVIQLDEKYCLETNKTIVINKSLTINGAENKTVIEGNNNYLYLDSPEKDNTIHSGEFIIIRLDDGGPKKTGKHIIFNNITFKNVKLQTWHSMEFNDCDFINSTFTSNELDNELNNCSFNNSTMEITFVKGFLTRNYTSVTNCRFFESEIRTKIKIPTYRIEPVGGDFFNIFDRINLTDCRFTNSKISLENNEININKTLFNATNISGHSNTIHIKDSGFYTQNIDWSICKTDMDNTTLNNVTMNLMASYFSIGSSTKMKNCSLSDSKIKITPGFRSRQSLINISDSNITNTYFDTTDTSVIIQNSTLNQSEMLLFFSSLRIADTTFTNNDTIENTIRTKLQEDQQLLIDGNITNKTIYYQIKTDYQINNTYLINSTGKYEITSENISKNTLYNFKIINQTVYWQNDTLFFELKEQNGTPVAGEKIYVRISENYAFDTVTLTTDENGITGFKLTELGNYTIYAYYRSPGYDFYTISYDITFPILVKSLIKDLKITKCDFKTNTYSTIGGYLKLKVTGAKNPKISRIKLTLKLTGKNVSKTYKVYTYDGNVGFFDIPRKLDAGTYKLKITVPNSDISKTITFKINPAKTVVKAPKVTNKYKKSQYFKIGIKNKITYKAISNVKVKIKVYTGKKYKTYTVKTDKKGMAKINTKTLKTGNHKVVVSSGNSNYEISAKSTIKIEK